MSTNKISESWRFNRTEWIIKLRRMSDQDLLALFKHHLNYIPGSSVRRLAMNELDRRGI